jgi:hypothetical protein
MNDARTDARSIGQDIQGQILETIRRSQEAVTDAIRTWADTIASLTPALPIPQPPFADKLPKPSEVVAGAYDFAEQLLAAQRKFAEDVLAAIAPVLAAATGSQNGSRKEHGSSGNGYSGG